MKATTLVLLLALTGCLFPEAQLEEAVVPDGLYLWLMADDGAIADESGLVSQWTDHSGSERHATQAFVALQPTKQDAAMGNLPAIHFDGSEDELDLPEGFEQICDGFTFFAVVRPDASAAGTPRSMFYIGNGGETDDLAVMGLDGDYLVELVDRQARIPEYLENTPAIVRVVMRTNAGTLGIAVNTGDEHQEHDVVPASCMPRALNLIGRDDYGLVGRFSGLLAEILFYERALEPTEVAEVTNYLNAKWSCCSP